MRNELAPGVRLASKQAVQHAIADSRAEIDAARLLVLRTAERIDAEGAKAARADVSLIKFFVAGVLDRVLGLSQRAEHPIGHGSQVRALLLESGGEPVGVGHAVTFSGQGPSID